MADSKQLPCSKLISLCWPVVWAEIRCMPTARAIKTRWSWAKPHNSVTHLPLNSSYIGSYETRSYLPSVCLGNCTEWITAHTRYSLTDFLCIVPLSCRSWSAWCVWFRWAVVWMRWPPDFHRRPLILLHSGATLNACYGYSKQVQISTGRYDIKCTLNSCLHTVHQWIE